jgi:hypothetical protein
LLGGTVTLPSFPATAMIRKPTQKERDFIGVSDGELIVIEQTIHPSTQILRFVQIDDAPAAFRPDKSHKESWEGGTWYEPSALLQEQEQQQQQQQQGQVQEEEMHKLLAFVSEHAPVMTIAIFAGTAAESADYVPPTCERSCERKVQWTLKDGTAPPT